MTAHEDLSGLFDPCELRNRLDLELEHSATLRDENTRLKEEIARLQGLPAPAARPAAAAPPPRAVPVFPFAGGDGLPQVDHSSSTEDKIALFRTLFRGREDVYAHRWKSTRTGKMGWNPAEQDPWDTGRPDVDRVLYPLTRDVVFEHLASLRQASRSPRARYDDTHIGLYPVLADDTCQLLAADFDGKKNGSDWRADAAAYAAACQDAGLNPLTEISRSGDGAHVWLFFTAPVLAATARALGTGLIRQAIAARGQMTLDSYDRLFPAQDALPDRAGPKARFGSLIALPLHGASRAQGTTVFADPDTWQPCPDQFARLSQVVRITPDQVKDLAGRLGQLKAGLSPAAALGRRPRRGELGKAPARVEARLDAGLEIATAGLPPQLVVALKHAASLHNPEFYKAQRARRSTFGKPRLISRFDATDPDWLKLPRGLADEAAALVAAAGGSLEITSEPAAPPPVTIRFTGTLRPGQQRAFDAMAPHWHGMLTAPTGEGKTVIACALIASRGVPTVVLVPGTELLSQWKRSIAAFLDLGGGQAGSLGGGKDRRSRVVDVMTLRSLTASEDPAGVLDGYGLAIVDECQAVGAPANEAAIGAARIPAWVGLSATPYRSDQMDPLIMMQCGPVRHEMESTTTFRKHLVIHPTTFTTEETGDDGPSTQVIYNEVAADAGRNALIAADIADAVRRGRCSIALCNRVEHLHQLTAALQPHGITPLLLHGAMRAAERAFVRDVLSEPDGKPLVLLAMDKIAGEGFDAPRLDTLFIAAPVKFKGKNIQQVGRIMRAGEGKSHVEAHDYLDADVPWLNRMHRQRRKVLERRGFNVTAAGSLPVTPPSAAPAARTQPPSPAPDVVDAARVRAWARGQGMDVPGRGKLRADIWAAWHSAHPAEDASA